MLHNSGGFGLGENPSNTNISDKTQKVSAPPNLGHNMENLSEIAQQQLRTTRERYDIPTHGSYNYELSSYNSNLGTSSAYQYRRLPDMFDPNTARPYDLNWEGSLPTHVHSIPYQNMPHYVPPFETPRINADHRSQSITNTHIPEHGNIGNYHSKYNMNKDNFNRYNQSFTTQESYKMDATKQKKLENTVKLIENIITNSSNRNNAPLTSCNEKQTQVKCDNQTKNMFNGSLEDQGTHRSHYKQPSKMEVNKELGQINPNKYHQIEPEFELINTGNRNLNKDVIEFSKKTAGRENNSTHKDAPHQDQTSVEKQNKSNDSTVNIKQKENSNPQIENQMIKTEESTINSKEKQSKSRNENNYNDLTNEHDETFLAEAELQIDNYNKIEIKAAEIANEKKSTGTENDFSAIFLRDPNKLSSRDVKKGPVVSCASSVEAATACVLKGTKKSWKCLYECEHCQHYFRHPKRFLVHVRWHTFGLAGEKRQDVVRQQLEKQQCKSARTQQCDYCEKQFKTLNSLTNHKQRFHSTEQLECPECGAAARGVAALRAHRRAAHPARWQCARAACRRVCTNKYTLAKHMRTHLEKHISCPQPQCPKLFATPAQLREHARVHERAARGPVYKCAHCPKSFYQTYNLHAHEKTHSNERPFGCDICGTRFSTNSSLKRHLKVSHSASKPFPCVECGRCFAERRTLVGHVSKAHPSTPSPARGGGGGGGGAAGKTMTQSHPRKGKRGKKSKKTQDGDTSDGQQPDATAEYMSV